MSIAKGFTAYEFIHANQTFSQEGFRNSDLFHFMFIHGIGFSLQTVSLFLMSLKVYFLCSFTAPKVYHDWIFYFIMILMSLSAILLAVMIHYWEMNRVTAIIIMLVDVCGIVLLIKSYDKSRQNYQNMLGKTCLETRYQMLKTYKWTMALIPCSLIAIFARFCALCLIWMFIVTYSGGEGNYFYLFLYKNILEIYIISLPILLVTIHENLRKKYIFPNQRSKEVKTFDGKKIVENEKTEDHFKKLTNYWNLKMGT